MRVRWTVACMLLLAVAAQAQIRGIPASVTSLGPHGFQGHFGHGAFFNGGFGHFKGGFGHRGFVGGIRFGHFNPGFRVVSPSRFFPRHHRRHFFGQSFGGAFPVFVGGGYGAPVIVQVPQGYAPEDAYDQRVRGEAMTRDEVRRAVAEELDAYFAERDRRAREEAEARAKPAAPAAQPEARETPFTVLVFQDGHREEVRNYAIVDSTVHILSPYRRKVPLADLDLDATSKANEDRGISFRLPARPKRAR